MPAHFARDAPCGCDNERIPPGAGVPCREAERRACPASDLVCRHAVIGHGARDRPSAHPRRLCPHRMGGSGASLYCPQCVCDVCDVTCAECFDNESHASVQEEDLLNARFESRRIVEFKVGMTWWFGSQAWVSVVAALDGLSGAAFEGFSFERRHATLWFRTSRTRPPAGHRHHEKRQRLAAEPWLYGCVGVYELIDAFVPCMLSYDAERAMQCAVDGLMRNGKFAPHARAPQRLVSSAYLIARFDPGTPQVPSEPTLACPAGMVDLARACSTSRERLADLLDLDDSDEESDD